MDKINDFFAAQLNAPDNFTLLDFYAYGLTPDNTSLKDADYYKGIDKVVERFSDADGKFDENKFNQFYESSRRAYNEWANTDFVNTIVQSIARSPEDITRMQDTNVWDTSTKLFEVDDMWRHQRGFGNLRETGNPSYDYREVAQANWVHDADDNVLGYKPNDVGGLFKGLFRKPLYLATDENGVPLLDPINGDPYYKELRDGESHYGKDMLHYSDTLTAEDTWLNKYDFFDNDGLDKSVGGTIARTIFKIAPYFIPYVGPVLGAIGAVYGLSRSLPTLAKAINGIVTHDSDETPFGQDLNSALAFFANFDTTKSRHASEHQWSFENIGDMIVTSAQQLFEQRTFTRIPEVLKLPATKLNSNLFGSLSLGYMALTSAESSLETFKKAGMSDTSAGISMIAYTAAMFGLMQSNYFKSWLFRNTWINAEPEITSAINGQSEKVAEGIMQSVKASTKGERLLKLAPTATEKQSKSLFKRIFNATKEAWNEKTFAPIRALDISAPGSVNAAKTTAGVYIHHSLNEGVEEVMEEQALDIIKLISLGLEKLGYDLTDETKEKLEFGLTWNDAGQRYLTAFVGGAIGGAVFQGMDDWHTKVLNGNFTKYTGRGVDGELTRAIRLYGEERVLKELERKSKKGIANTNLAMSGKWTKDPTDSSKEIWTWDEKGDKLSQNDVVYNALKIKIKALAEIMRKNQLLLTDEEVLKKILTPEQFQQFERSTNPILQQIRKDVKEGAAKENISEQEYRKKHHINNFEEFAKKSGFADVIITDFGNIALDIVELDQEIERRKGFITAQFPDSRASEREEAIKKDVFIKDLEDKKKKKKEQLDALYAGKAASYYIRYANFASSSELVSSLISATGPNVLSKESFAFLRHHITYYDADANEKEVIDKEYAAYIKSKGIDALQRANEVFQYAQDLFTPVLKEQLEKLVSTNATSDINATAVENPEQIDPSTLLDRSVHINMNADPKKVLNPEEIFQNLYASVDVTLNVGIDEKGNPITIGQRYGKLLDMAIETYKTMKEQNAVGLEADDFIKYAFRSIGNDLARRMSTVQKDRDTFINTVGEITSYELAKNSSKEELIELLKDDSRFAEQLEILETSDDEEEIKEVSDLILDQLKEEYNNYLAYNRFFDKDDTSIYSDAINSYKTILNQLDKDPEKAIELIKKFERDLNSNSATDPLAKQAVMDMFHMDLLKTVAEKIKQAVEISKELKVTPTIELAKILTFSLMGTENPLLDIIANERAALTQKGIRDYVYSNAYNKIQLQLAENILPIVKAVIFTASSGMNENANEILEAEGAELLPVISPDIAYIYQNDLDFLENQISYLRELSEVNSGLKEREHILVRTNFYRNIVNFFTSETDDEETIEVLKKIETALGGFNFKTHVDELGLRSFDFSDDSKENQVKLMIAFQNLEHSIFEHVKQKGLNLGKVSYGIFTSFNDIYKMKNGILSKNEDDTLQNFDIATYLMCVVGVDSYWFGKKLTKRFEDEGKKPFFGQELAIRLICLNILHPEMINDANSAIYDSTEAAWDNGLIVPEDPKNEEEKTRTAAYLKGRTKLNNTVIIDGFAGCGKSSVIHNIALSFFDNINEVSVSKIKSRAEAMGLDEDHTYSLIQLFAKALGKDKFVVSDYIGLDSKSAHNDVWLDANVKLNFDKVFGEPTDGELRVLTIDECTLVKEGMWQALIEAAERQNVRIIGLGNLMQSGEITNTGIPAGLDDCVGVLSTKLSISMRNANAGKSANDDALGRVVAKLVDARKDKLGWNEELIMSTISTPEVDLQFGFTPERKLAGDQIVPQIDATLIQGTIDSLQEGETLMIITPEGSFQALREKYKDSKNIKFVTASDAPGDESDYVILNERFENITNDNKFSILQKIYTLLTRAKKGTKVVQSQGLTDLNIYNSGESVTATIDVSFDPNSKSAKDYVDTKLQALKAIPVEETENKDEKNEKEEQKPVVIKPAKNPIQSSNLAENTQTDEEVAKQIETAVEQEAQNVGESELNATTNTKEDDNGDENLGVGLRGLKLRAYKEYLALKRNPGYSVIDTEEFANWLFETPFTQLTPLCPLKATNKELDSAFREFILGVSSIILNHKPSEWSKTFVHRSNNLHRAELYSALNGPKFINAFEESLKNKTGVLFKKPYVGNRMILYYCFDEYAIPISIYNVVDSESDEGFITITDNLFKQRTSIIPITSRGEHRSSVIRTIPKSISLASLNNTPVTAIFLGTEDDMSFNPIRRNAYFMNHSRGKAFAVLLHEFGMTDDEIVDIFTAPIENGVYEYFLKNDPNLYAIAGVQRDAEVLHLLDILADLNYLSYGNTSIVNEDANKAIKEVSQFFGGNKVEGYDEETIRADFEAIYQIESGELYEQQRERYKKLRNKYNILDYRDVDRFISALFSYFSQNDADNLSNFTQNLILKTGVYNVGNEKTVENLRYRGFHFALKPGKEFLNFYIIPSNAEGSTFDIYYTSTNRSGDVKNKIGQTSWNSLFKSNDAFTSDLKQIIHKLLEIDAVKEQILKINSKFDPESIYELIANNTAMFSLTTAIPEGDGSLNFYSPFEGDIITLLTNQDRALMITGDDLENLVKTSNIFKYGVFRRIQTSGGNIVQNQALWTTGKVQMEHLTWDIPKVLSPLYTMSFEKRPDVEQQLKLEKKYKELLSVKVDTSELVDVQLEGNKITFANNNVRTSVPINNEVKELLGNRIGSYTTLKTITLNQDGIEFTLSDNDGVDELVISILDSNPKETVYKLLQKYGNSEIIKKSRTDIRPTKYSYTFNSNNVYLVLNDTTHRYMLQVNGDYFDFKNHGSLRTNSGEIYIYLSSNAFGDEETIYKLKTSSGDPLFDSTKQFLGTNGYLHYYYNDRGIWEQDWSGSKQELHHVNLLFSGDTEFRVNVEGNESTIPFSAFTNEGKQLISKFPDQIAVEKGTVMRKGKNLWIIDGQLTAPQWFLRQISDYNIDSGLAIINSFDFKHKLVTINGIQYKLNDGITKQFISDRMTLLEIKEDIRPWIKRGLRAIQSKIENFDEFVNDLSELDDPVEAINNYLENNKEKLKGSYYAELSKNGDISIKQKSSMNDSILNEVLKQIPNSKYDDFQITVIDSNDSKTKFSVSTIDGTTLYDGEAELTNGNWNIRLTTPNENKVSSNNFSVWLNKIQPDGIVDPYLKIARKKLEDKPLSKEENVLWMKNFIKAYTTGNYIQGSNSFIELISWYDAWIKANQPKCNI